MVESTDHTVRRRIYIANIQGSGGIKLPALKACTKGYENMVVFETNTRVGAEKSIALGNAISLVDNQQMFGEEKGLGYGTAVMSTDYDRNRDKVTYKSKVHEITALTQHLSLIHI